MAGLIDADQLLCFLHGPESPPSLHCPSAQLEHVHECNDHTTLADLGQHPLSALEPDGRRRLCQPVDDDSRRHRRAAED